MNALGSCDDSLLAVLMSLTEAKRKSWIQLELISNINNPPIEGSVLLLAL